MGPTDERLAQLEAYARSQGLTAGAAATWALVAGWGEFYGYQAPAIVSGRRSEARQRELRAAWDRGDRAGLVARPALYSNHTRGEAFDLARGPGLDFFIHAAPYVGLRWGGNFREADPVHFDLGNS